MVDYINPLAFLIDRQKEFTRDLLADMDEAHAEHMREIGELEALEDLPRPKLEN